ncbi:MAG: hypothetical protein JNK05_21705 [Myxococcales bacterium]|nr:hypothetical protein [Myxococcales bacterium]
MTASDRAWLDEIVGELDLVAHGPLLLLVDKADDAQLPALLRALEARGAPPVLSVTVRGLVQSPPGSVVLYAPDPAEMAALNAARTVLRDRRLKVLLWCDEPRTRALYEGASDVYDWISRYIECPRGVPLFPVLRVKRWTEEGIPYVELQGSRWREVLDATGERWTEVPHEVLDEYAKTVAFVRAHPGERFCVRELGLEFGRCVRLVVAARSEGTMLPVAHVGEVHLRWYRRVQAEPVGFPLLIERSPNLAASDAAGLGVELLHFEDGVSAWTGLARPVPAEGDPVLESLWQRYDDEREDGHPIGMDPSYRLRAMVDALGDARRQEQVATGDWYDWLLGVETLYFGDVLAEWVREEVPFAKSNPVLLGAGMALAGERVPSPPTPAELIALVRAQRDELDRRALCSIVGLLWLSHSLQRGEYRWAYDGFAQIEHESFPWMDETLRALAAWLSGELPGEKLRIGAAILPPIVDIAMTQAELDCGPHVRPDGRTPHPWFHEWFGDDELLGWVHSVRYRETPASEHLPTDELPALPEGESVAERRGLLHAWRRRLLNAEVALEEGAFDRADDGLQRAFEGLVRHAGEQHPMTLYALAMRGRLFARLGAHERAGDLLRRALAALAAQLGPTHPEALRVRLELARIEDGSVEGVASARSGLIDALERRFGPRSPLTQSAQRECARWSSTPPPSTKS